VPEITGAEPVLPVADLHRAVEHYRALGFDVERYEGDAAYAFARWGAVQLHLCEVASIDPAASMVSVYLRVDDADALHSEWQVAGVHGRLVEPDDAPYGLREGAHVDPDGNLLRFGSPR
jgi:catechol 2,3-dioxygenase-like lactoylglutathione lyase family enzyme